MGNSALESLTGKVALVTGASSGIGEGLARELARRGARVGILARRKDRLDALARAVDPSGENILAIECDVTREGDVAGAVQRVVAQFGQLDIVMANAGISVAGEVDGTPIEAFRQAFATNVFGVVNTVRATTDALRNSRGALAIIGSIAGFGFVPGATPYVMSKFAVRGLAYTLRIELAPEIAVTHVAPGFVASEIRGPNDPTPSWLVLPTAAAARAIVQGTVERRREMVLPLHAKAFVAAERHAPWLLHSLVSLRRRRPQDRRPTARPRTVLITGAASGIGAALADLVVERGDRAVLFDRDPRLPERWASHPHVSCAVGDILDRRALDRAVAAGIGRFGPLDDVVANAGIVAFGALSDLDRDTVQRVFDVNVLGTLNTVQATVGSLRASRGRLVVIGSASGYLAYGGLSIYNASKFAVRGMTRQLRYELARSGVAVTHVAPGAVATNIWDGKMPAGAMTPRQAAGLIAAAVDAGRQELAFPRRTLLEIRISRHAPVLHERLLRRAWRG